MIENMTLGEAIPWLDRTWACACIGGPGCCQRWDAQALLLQRAAHIAIKMVADLENRGGVREPVRT